MDEEDTVIDPVSQANDNDRALRPKKLDDFIGQTGLKANLAVFIESARRRNDTMDHTLFYGPPGLGKTTLAQIISSELGVNFRMTSGPVLAKAGDLAAILTNLEEKDVLFIDEIHRMNSAVEEVLYPALEDFELDLVIGEGPAARTVRIELQPFTLVGATTRLGLLTTPLRDRFGIPIRLEFYSVEELLEIVLRASKFMEIQTEHSGGLEIAKRSRGTPRIANRLLRRVADFAVVDGNGTITKEIADSSLSRIGVDIAGLDNADRKYLKIIAENYAGGPVGVETISAAMSEARDAIEEVIEPYLLQQGFLKRTSRGRVITEKAWLHLGIELIQNNSQPDLLDHN
ncbi:MAG: Holliday junction branch migration DNA helicase RuvB [Rhodobacteraceae bacterium]|nr:Holliday junction branch migration DNA helicase RuvB [Paracoccaceae bacterium]|tara:strand:+ start:1188 stop:2219 length:1032 start_codon:yes stop_codon:yes gene_type:complete